MNTCICRVPHLCWELKDILKLDVEALISALLLNSLLLVSSLGPFWGAFAIFGAIPLLLLCFKYKRPSLCLTNFYISWAITSFVLLVSVFEFIVVPFLEIYIYENVILLSLAASALTCAIIVRKGSQPSTRQLCGHSVDLCEDYVSWLNATVTCSNRLSYMCGLLFAALGLIYGAQLTITTICHPFLLYNTFLVPDDCSDVYGDMNLSFSFSLAIYSLEVAFFLIFHMTLQTWKYCFQRPSIHAMEMKRNEC